MLPDTDLGDLLLARARATLERLFVPHATPLPDDPRLADHGATFVTLTREGELRGCVGNIRARRPLSADVTANAIAAATCDARFPPLTLDELNVVLIEVSLLSEPSFLDVADEAGLISQLRPGVDGVVLFAGCRHATFLPQVWEQLPDPKVFLAALRVKAGLTPDTPLANLIFATYTVRKWREAEAAIALPATAEDVAAPMKG